MRTGARTTLGYHDHYIVDGGKQRNILAALVTSADVMENVPLQDLLWRVFFRRKLRHHRKHRRARGSRYPGVLPLPDFETRTPFFGRGKFV